MAGKIPAQERFLAVPRAEREAQDLLFLGEFLLGAGKTEQGKAALQKLVKDYPGTPRAAETLKRLEQMK